MEEACHHREAWGASVARYLQHQQQYTVLIVVIPHEPHQLPPTTTTAAEARRALVPALVRELISWRSKSLNLNPPGFKGSYGVSFKK